MIEAAVILFLAFVGIGSFDHEYQKSVEEYQASQR